jgi:hypothetical protein
VCRQQVSNLPVACAKPVAWPPTDNDRRRQKLNESVAGVDGGQGPRQFLVKHGATRLYGRNR